MNDLDVRIVTLEPFRVASAHGFGPQPEGIATSKLHNWANERGLVESGTRFFGFNNPSPSEGSPNYGYEFWMTVDDAVQTEGDIAIKDFSGGLYAVTRVQGVENIYPTWQKMVAWLENSPYQMGQHQWLEEEISGSGDPELMTLDLYMPIRK